ncbi:hypothetical protein NLU13_9010 [Sarocladium strictum]|uniref:Uncharacterized protein n=1 Tax=Sarocladium strictum TaxID=5046 RepID=A0AA39G9U2_SARSR|nr:hypothetical protein NLU13_9010 [Sarocladium strictum]
MCRQRKQHSVPSTGANEHGNGKALGDGGQPSDASNIIKETGPSVAAASIMLGLIFGGCCSNVYALEAIVKHDPRSGTLMTFAQFLFVAVTGYLAQFDKAYPPFFVPPNKVPLRRWMINIILFFSINVLNNHAFSYDISVPVHIILRSGGSITTMCAGYLWGKRYSRIQVTAVVFLTLGVILAAWSDAQAKGASKSRDEVKPAFGVGLAILFLAQILSAVMGLYTEATYSKYGPHWKENLFYSHVLSLPLFLPFAPSMYRTLRLMMQTKPFVISVPMTFVPIELPIASQIGYLITNVLCQYACIRGVNLLAAVSSALTVTIVLNIRKLISLLLSIWLFGNSLPAGTILGAVIVFGSGALYSLDGKKAKAKPITAQETGKKHRKL